VPHVYVKAHDNFFVGMQFRYGFGEIEDAKLPVQKGFGIGVKYFYRNRVNNRFIQNRLMPYSEFSWNLLDYALDNSQEYGYRPLQKFENHQLELLTGTTFRLFDYLYLDYALRGVYGSKNSKFLFVNRVGFQYHFGEERNIVPKPLRPDDDVFGDDKLKLLDFSYFLKRSTVNTRYGFVFYDIYETGDLFYYKEKALSVALSTSLSSDIDFGILLQPIWTSVRGEPGQQYFRFGPFIQYDVIRRPKSWRFFLETGFMKSNFCHCGDFVSFKESNLSSVSFGFGAEWAIAQTNLHLGASMYFYRITNAPDLRPYSYGQPTLSASYKFFEDLK
jgi:hypothetical protein